MPALPDTRTIYLLLVAAVGLQRLVELRVSARHARQLLARGGVEAGRRHLPWMILFHAVFLVACPVEVMWGRRPLVPVLAASALAVLLATQVLRYWAIATLGERWSVRVIAVPGARPIVRGPYRWLRHPNYLAVILEVAALPLIHTAYMTAAVGTALNGVLLAVRIRAEERLLRGVAADAAALFSKPRFAPHV